MIHRSRLPYLALVAVCLLWGTTYLGIRIALEDLPALYLIAIRYTISGGLLLAAAYVSRLTLPSWRAALQTAVCGAICIGIGNGLLAIAEKNGTPSGLAALFYTTAPFWLIGFDALLPGGKKPLPATVRGLLVGVAGVVVLVLPSALREGVRGTAVIGFVLLQVSAAGWTFGALLQKRVVSKANALVTGAIQQLAAGFATFIPAICFETLPHAVSQRTMWAIVYLVVFGSLIGFSCFIYSVAMLPVAIVSIYTFINPIVAVFLGWWIVSEPFGIWQLVAMCIIFAGIAIVRSSEARPSPVIGANAIGDAEALGPET